jgi:predicted alpha/beta hydrolase family esterase
MRNAIIVHGKPTRHRYEDPTEPKPHEANWLPWFGGKLEAAGKSVAIPAMPRPYFPVYTAWKKRFEAIPLAVTRDTALIGHSAGAEFILRLMSEGTELEADMIVAVAPYKDEAEKYGDFSRYNLDPELPRRVGKIVIISSLDEPIQRRARQLADVYPEADFIELEGYGHFRIGHNMSGPEFPDYSKQYCNKVSS